MPRYDSGGEKKMLRTISMVLWIIGFGLMAYAFFWFDPTVAAPEPVAGMGSLFPTGRTANLQLLVGQLVLTINGAALFVGGCVVEVAASVRDASARNHPEKTGEGRGTH